MERVKSSAACLLALTIILSATSLAQQAAATGEPLAIETVSPTKAFLRQQYRFELRAGGGITPLHWEVTGGSLPDGLALNPDGVLSGVPMERGEFRFTVTVTDSGKPAHEKSQELTLLVVAPLLLQWSRLPKINGQRIECAVTLANQTGQDFDLTLIALAVNEIGRATAVGYQRLTLRGDTEDMEIPFSENLPPGMYQLNVDAVAEVPESNNIYRARLVTREKLEVQPIP
ncbi:MAG TPA: Ig domain-containing protein [Terriglobales bacterium]|nr:Ig domain-containing protein [Terriglobales bacterium]